MAKISDRIPSYYLLLAFAAGGVLVGFSVRQASARPAPTPPVVAAAPTPSPAACEVRSVRLRGYAGIEPLLMTERDCESPRFADIKSGISQLIHSFQMDGTLMTASVYLRDLERGEWTVVNDGERYDPGSLLKVPVMMAYLRASESDPRVLSTNYSVGFVPSDLPKPVFPPKEIISTGKNYSVPDLMHRSIAKSDNIANLVLLQHVNMKVLKRLFEDLSLQPVDEKASRYPMTAREYSAFMKVLFNSSYLNITNSEFAMAQLSDCDFDRGLRAGVPTTVKMAHKFGESGDGQQFQLHESAIVYMGNTPYLLTVMTRGAAMEKLPDVLKAFSTFIYHDMSQRKS